MRFVRAYSMVRPPTRPKYIKRIRMIREAAVRSPVMPSVRPTVATADAASKAASIRVACSSQTIRKDAENMSPKYMARMAMALRRMS